MNHRKSSLVTLSCGIEARVRVGCISDGISSCSVTFLSLTFKGHTHRYSWLLGFLFFFAQMLERDGCLKVSCCFHGNSSCFNDYTVGQVS